MSVFTAIPRTEAVIDTHRTEVNTADQVVTAFPDGTYWDNEFFAEVATNGKTQWTGYNFPDTNISQYSLINSATLQLNYYNGYDFNATGTLEHHNITVGYRLDGGPNWSYDILVHGATAQGFQGSEVLYDITQWDTYQNYTIDVTDLMQELVLNPGYQAGWNVKFYTFWLSQVGPGFDTTYFSYNVAGTYTVGGVHLDRPQLTVDYEPGGYYDQFIDTTTPGGNTSIPVILTDVNTTDDHFGIFESPTVNNSYPVFELSDGENIRTVGYAGQNIEYLNDSLYVLGYNNSDAMFGLYSSNNSGVDWWLELSIRAVLPEATALAWDNINQVFHVAYATAGDVYYDNLTWTGMAWDAAYGPGAGATVKTASGSAGGLAWSTDFDNTWCLAWNANGQSRGARFFMPDPIPKVIEVFATGLNGATNELLAYNNTWWYCMAYAPPAQTVRFYVFNGNLTSGDMTNWANFAVGGSSTLGDHKPGGFALGNYNYTTHGPGEKLVFVNADFVSGLYYPEVCILQNNGTVTNHKANVTAPHTSMTNGPITIITDQNGTLLVMFGLIDNGGGEPLTGIYAVPVEWFFKGDDNYLISDFTPYRVYTDKFPLDANNQVYISAIDPILTNEIIAGPGGSTFNSTDQEFTACVGSALLTLFGTGPYTEDQINEGIAWCEGGETAFPPVNTTDPYNWSTTRKTWKMMFIFLGMAFIAVPWLIFASTKEMKYLAYIIILNSLGFGLLLASVTM